jgi:S1-C subfamily serine protease
MNRLVGLCGLLLVGSSAHQDAVAGLADTVARVRDSVVAVGTYQTVRRPPAEFRGTGFVIGDGRFVATNEHVVSEAVDEGGRERLAIFAGRGTAVDVRTVKVVARDPEHDLALLEVSGTPLKPLALGNDARVREGDSIAFTGFPLGMALGLHHVTHRGIVASVAPAAIPGIGGRDLEAKTVKALRDPYPVFQLDATAYPGNSGSPLYDPENGEVLGVINSVLVKGTKESLLEKPSGITYAVPVRFLKALLAGRGGSRASSP